MCIRDRPISVPDRKALGIDCYTAAARGAYLIRDFDGGKPRQGTIIVQGTISTSNVIKALPEINKRGLNVKIVAGVSPELFRLQDQAYQDRILPMADFIDSTVITNMSRRAMYDWLGSAISKQYAMTADFDNQWRSGGRLDEIAEEAHLSPEWILQGIERFVNRRRKLTLA